MGMRGEKIAPARRWLSPMDASHVLRDGPGGDREAQSCQFRLDTLLSPQEVLGRHATNEMLHVRRNVFSSRSSSASRTPAPISFPPLSVPSQNRSRGHDHKRFSPVWAPPGCEDPEPTILVLQSWPGMPSLQNQKLLAEAWILSHRRRLGPEECHHGPNYSAYQASLPLLLLSAEVFHGRSRTESGADIIFAPYN